MAPVSSFTKESKHGGGKGALADTDSTWGGGQISVSINIDTDIPVHLYHMYHPRKNRKFGRFMPKIAYNKNISSILHNVYGVFYTELN